MYFWKRLRGEGKGKEKEKKGEERKGKEVSKLLSIT